jgi:hypothetical protein
MPSAKLKKRRSIVLKSTAYQYWLAAELAPLSACAVVIRLSAATASREARYHQVARIGGFVETVQCLDVCVLCRLVGDDTLIAMCVKEFALLSLSSRMCLRQVD